jgi:hypothetical protein
MDGRGNNLKKFSKKRTKRKTTTYSKLPSNFYYSPFLRILLIKAKVAVAS